MERSFLVLGAALAMATTLNSVAYADVERLTIRLAGGCRSDDTNGACVIKVTASGTDLESETVQLFTAAKPGDPLRRYSSRLRSLDENGRASFRIKNIPRGCYQARTGPNGNDKPDVKSQIICE